jgi:hypothetical protein
MSCQRTLSLSSQAWYNHRRQRHKDAQVSGLPNPQDDYYKSLREGEEYLNKTYAKMTQCVEDFASGKINRAQFQQLYAHYEREIAVISQLLAEADDPNAWRKAVTEGESVYIRKRHQARSTGFAIYDTDSGMPIETLGDFEVDSALLVPMLSSYHSATTEIFRAGMRNTQMENGQWLCFVPGRFTTLITLFSQEPTEQQLEMLSRMHDHFEIANREALETRTAQPGELALPFLAILKQAAGKD